MPTLDGLYRLAQGLTAYEASAYELGIRQFVLDSSSETGWRWFASFPELEVGLEDNPGAYIYVGPNSGMFQSSPPDDIETVATCYQHTKSTFVRDFIASQAQRHFPGSPCDPVPSQFDGVTVRRIRNALLASDPTTCASSLERFRARMLALNMWESFTAIGYRDALRYEEELRSSFARDAHMISLVAFIPGLLQLIDDKSDSTNDSIRSRAAVLAPMLRDEVAHPALATIETASAAIRQGYVEQLFQLGTRYRNRLAEARKDALACRSSAEMLDTLFHAIPAALTATAIFGVLKTDDASSNFDGQPMARIAKAADEELVRMSFAFVIEFMKIRVGRRTYRDHMIARIASNETTASEAQTQLSRDFTYPHHEIDALNARVQREPTP